MPPAPAVPNGSDQVGYNQASDNHVGYAQASSAQLGLDQLGASNASASHRSAGNLGAGQVDVLDTRTSRPDLTTPEPDLPPQPSPPPARYSTGRAAALLVLVLALQLGFVAAFIGALEAPPAGDLPVAVVTADAAVSRVEAAVQKPADPPEIVEYADRKGALEAVHGRRAYAALVPDGTGGTELLIATESSDPTARALVREYGKAGFLTGVRIVIFDDYSPRPDDTANLSTFYLVVAWVFGGLVAATALALALGSIPGTRNRTQARVLALLAYSLVSGLTSAALVGPGLDVWNGYGLALTVFGTMITFGAAMTAAALQSWFGLLGAGTAIALFALLSNPGSTGPVPADLLPAAVRGLEVWALPWAGTQLVRGVVDIGTTGGNPLSDFAVLWAYCLGGAVAFLVAGHVKPGRYRARLTRR